MRNPDINRVRKAIEHLNAAQTVLQSIKWENMTSNEAIFRASAFGKLQECRWILNDILTIGKDEK